MKAVDALKECLDMARVHLMDAIKRQDERLIIECERRYLDVASRLAPYQEPKLTALAVKNVNPTPLIIQTNLDFTVVQRFEDTLKGTPSAAAVPSPQLAGVIAEPTQHPALADDDD